MEDRYGWIKEYDTIPTRADNKIKIKRKAVETQIGGKNMVNIYTRNFPLDSIS